MLAIKNQSLQCHLKVSCRFIKPLSISYKINADDVLVTGSRDGSSKIWNLKSLSVATSLKGHTDEITTIIITVNIMHELHDSIYRPYIVGRDDIKWML